MGRFLATDGNFLSQGSGHYFCTALKLRTLFTILKGFKCICNRELRWPAKPKHLLSGPPKVCWPLFYIPLNQFLSDCPLVRCSSNLPLWWWLSISPCSFAKCCIFTLNLCHLLHKIFCYIFLMDSIFYQYVMTLFMPVIIELYCYCCSCKYTNYVLIRICIILKIFYFQSFCIFNICMFPVEFWQSPLFANFISFLIQFYFLTPQDLNKLSTVSYCWLQVRCVQLTLELLHLS